MSHSHANRIAEASGVRLAIVSPDGRQGMLEHARDLARAKIPYVLDPGQGLPMFSGDDLLEMLAGARCLTVNDYEARLVEQKTGKPIAELGRHVECVVVTRGAEGADILVDGGQLRVPAVRADSLVDPTGCGDAFRAGLLFGMVRGWDWRKSGRLASLMGSIKIACRGGQNHRPTRGEIDRRFEEAFAEKL
jgi:adenosine kinase